MMTSSISSSSSASSISSYTARQQRVVDALRVLMGERAVAVYEAHGRSLGKVAGYARDGHLPDCQRLVTGLQLAQELLAEEMLVQTVFTSPTAVSDYLKLHFAGQTCETFVVLFLSSQNRLLAAEEMFKGSLTQTAVYPREIVRRCLHHNAGGVIFAHNHPSGSVEPSRADEALTVALKSALALVDVRVLDHIVVAGSRSTSFAERGLM